MSQLQDERYIVTYNPTKDKVYALLKDQAKPDDILKAAFHVSNDCIHYFGNIALVKVVCVNLASSIMFWSTGTCVTAFYQCFTC